MKFILSLTFFTCFSQSLFSQVQPDHTVILILENHSYSQIVGNVSAPYINSLITDSNTAVLTQSYGIGHPSQPNYIRLFSGSSQGVADNNVPTSLPFVTPNLGASLLQNGYSFKGYSESLPFVGFTGASFGQYMRKHNPWVNWQGDTTNGISILSNQPFTFFPPDFNDLPNVSIVVPDQDNDMHDGSVATGDAWVQANLSAYVEWCKTNNGLFILTFDEDDGSENNRILTTFTGRNIQKGFYDQKISHYNILRTIEELYRLSYAGWSADSAAIKNIWKTAELCNNGSVTLSTHLSGSSFQWQVNSGTGFINLLNNSNYSGVDGPSIILSNISSAFYGYQYRCIVDGTAGNPVKILFTNYWKGAVDTSWINPLNWTCGLPDGNTDVIMNRGRLVLNTNMEVRSFKVNNGAVFTNGVGGQLLIKY